MAKRLHAILLLLLAVPAIAWLGIASDHIPHPSLAGLVSGDYAASLERVFQQNFPYQEWFSNLAWNLRYRTGAKEIDGYFITGQGSIIKNVAEPDPVIVEQNQEALLRFARRIDAPQTYLMLLPTACAIKQQELPEFSESVIFSQKKLIEETYQEFAGELTTINAYPVLFSHQDQYLYYNTEDMLTPLGGYYAYTALGPKLGYTPYGLSQFNVEYAQHQYNGYLAQKFPYAKVEPDILTLYHFSNRHFNQIFMRNYRVQYENEGNQITMMGLYQRDSLTSNQPMNVYWGGTSQVVRVDITGNTSAKPSDTRLLIVGDGKTASYLPFLTPHFGEIVLLNAESATEQQFAAVDVTQFDQVLFAFSTDTYLHSAALRNIEAL